MFGLFGKSGFDTEMAEFEKRHKSLVAELMGAMQRFDLMGQMKIMESMLSVYDQKIECCKKYGKFEAIAKLEAERQKLQQLHG